MRAVILRLAPLAAAVFAAVICSAALKVDRQAPEPCYEFDCAVNDPCANDDACFGPCVCDVETSTCVPRG